MATPFSSLMRSRPQEFRRLRSPGTTLVSALVAVACIVLAVWAALNFGLVVDFLRYEGNQIRWENRSGGAPYLVIPALLVVATVFAVRAIRRNGDWIRVDTGARVRRLVTLVYTADNEFFASLSAGLATGDPHVFAPLPTTHHRGPITVDLWAADADRTAWAFAAVRGSVPFASQPVTTITGTSYDALQEHFARGTLVRAATDSPLLAPALAAAPADAAVIPYSVAAAERILRRTARRRVYCGALFALGVIGVVFGTTEPSRIAFLVFGAVIAVVSLIWFFVNQLGHSKARQAFGRLTGRYAAISAQGIELEAVTLIPWSNVKTIVVLDRRAELAGFVSVLNPLQGASADYARASGIGDTGIAIVLNDGTSAAVQVTDPSVRGIVGIVDSSPLTPKPGVITVMPDNVVSSDNVVRMVTQLNDQAVRHGISVQVVTATEDYARIQAEACGISGSRAGSVGTTGR